jgi:hypothetical protein
MPFPALHTLFNIGAFYPFRNYFGKYWLVFAGLSGLIMDLDFALQFIFGPGSFFAHGYFFHTIGFILCLLIIALIMFLKNKEYGKYGFIIVIGSLLHLLLDYVLGGGKYYIALFYPFYSSGFHLHLLMKFQESNIFGIFDAIAIFISLGFYYIILKIRR